MIFLLVKHTHIFKESIVQGYLLSLAQLYKV